MPEKNNVSKIIMVVTLIIVCIAAITVSSVMLIRANKKSLDNKAAQAPAKVVKQKLVVGTSKEYAGGSYPSEMLAADTEISYYSHVYEPLVSFSADRRLLPNSGLATNWVNPNDTTWRFTLNSKAKFSDGTPVTAADVKFTYDYLLKQNYQIVSNLPVAQEVTVVNDHTVDFITANPDPTFINKLPSLLILSKQDVEKNGDKNPIGSGPYKIGTLGATDESQGVIRILVANPNYWGQTPLIREVVYKDIKVQGSDTLDMALAKALVNKQIDISTNISDPAAISYLRKANKVNISTQYDNSVYFLLLNSLDNTPLKDVRVRKALAMSIDTQKLLDTNGSGGEVANQIISQSIFGYDPSLKKVAYNPTQAKSLLAEAGYPNGFDLTISAPQPVGNSNDTTMPILKTQLAKVGINVTAKELGGEEYFNALSTAGFQSIVASYVVATGDSSEILDLLFHTRGQVLGTMNSGYSNAQVDSLIEKAATTMDPKTRQPLLKQAMDLITSDVAYIPFYSSYVHICYSKDIYLPLRSDNLMKFNDMAGLATK